MFTVYVLYSKEYNKIYIGCTSNIEARLSDKNTGYTKRFQPWKVIYSKKFETKSEAMQREKELKSSRGRAFIRNYII